jgi:hypothetical protein
MNIFTKGAAKRLILSLLLAAGLGGCAVYAPPYANDPYGYGYGYGYGRPAYVGPPVSIDLGFGFYDYGGGYYGGGRGRHGHHGGHGWR